jgi:hypothetical protein
MPEQKGIQKKPIIQWEGLTMSKTFFKQMRTVSQKEYEMHVIAEQLNIIDPINWQGWVLDAVNSSVGEIQVIWFIFTKDETLCKIQDKDLFWLMRSRWDPREDAIAQFRATLPQIFTHII